MGMFGTRWNVRISNPLLMDSCIICLVSSLVHLAAWQGIRVNFAGLGKTTVPLYKGIYWERWRQSLMLTPSLP